MKRVSIVLFLVASLTLLVFSGCSMQLEQPSQTPQTETGAVVGGDGVIDYRLNPELLLIERQRAARMAEEELAAGAELVGMAVTDASQIVGEWICEQEDGQQLIRMDPDGRIVRVLGPDDAVEFGQFWFSDGEFHIVSDVDDAVDMSAFHAFVESDETGTYLRFELCGGNCPNAGDIEWVNGLTRS